ncbi:MAG: hypothetical protein ACUVTW_10695 [Thermogutta sp.]
MGWAVRGAAFLATFAAALWLSRPVTEEAAVRGVPDFPSSARGAAGGAAHRGPIVETFPQDRWDAWLSARQTSQSALAEYAAIAEQIPWFLWQNVAALRDARRYGSALLSQRIPQQTNAAPSPTSAETDAAAANSPPPADAERQRWLALKGRFARLEAERAQLLATHTPAHPEVAQLDGVLAELGNEIRQLERRLDGRDAWARDGSRLGPNREFAESPPHGDDLAFADLQPTVGNGLAPGIAEKSWYGAEQAEAFCEAMRSLAAGEATLSHLLEQAMAAGREVQAALREEEKSAAALREAWRDAAIRAAAPTPIPDSAGPSAAAVSGRAVSDWAIRGTLAAALGLLATIAAGWIWSGLHEPGESSGEGVPPRRYWRADGPERLSGPKLLAR